MSNLTIVNRSPDGTTYFAQEGMFNWTYAFIVEMVMDSPDPDYYGYDYITLDLGTSADGFPNLYARLFGNFTFVYNYNSDGALVPYVKAGSIIEMCQIIDASGKVFDSLTGLNIAFNSDKTTVYNEGINVFATSFRPGEVPDWTAAYSGNDTLIGNSGSEVLHGLGGNDTLFGHAGVDQLWGDAGDDVLDGGADPDDLYGGDGNDTIVGYTTNDYINGGNNFDIWQLTGTYTSGDSVPVDYDMRAVTTYNMEAIRVVYGNFIFNQNQVGGSSTIQTLLGGSQYRDSITVRASDDVNATGTIINLAGVTFQDWNNYSGDFDLVNIEGTGAADTIDGSSVNDNIIAYAGNNVVRGHGGDDNIVALEGNDTLRGGDGADTLVGYGGNDILIGDDDFAQFPNAIHGDDSLNGGSGNDILVALGGFNLIDGGDGIDTVDYGFMVNSNGYPVSCTINLSTTVNINDPGNSAFSAFAGTYVDSDGMVWTAAHDIIVNVENVDGSDYADTITGNADDNVLNGHSGNDNLMGGDGNDRFSGGLNDDTVDGGIGTDTVIFSGYFADYAIARNAVTGAYFVEDLTAGRDGLDTINNVENFQFLDGIKTASQLLNHSPTASNQTVSTYEDTTKVFTISNFAFNDVDTGDALQSIMITALETAGSLKFNGGEVTLNQVIAATDISAGRLTFTPSANANGTGYANFKFKVSDGMTFSALAYTMTVNVNAINDAPSLSTFTAPVASGNEDTTIAVTLASLKAQGNEADIDGTVDAFVVKAVSSGTLKIGTSLATATAWTAGSNDLVDATRIAYWTPTANANGTLNAFTAVAKDNGGLQSASPVQVKVNVTAVRDDLTLNGTSANDALNGDLIDSGSFDTLNGLAGNDTLNGLAGNDTLNGGTGNDLLNGGTGVDRLTGGDGSDTYVVDNGSDIVSESNAIASTGGTDLVQSYISYSLVDTDGAGAYGGNVENLRLMGSSALNGTGNSLNNVIYANAGSNTLNGGAGIDIVSYQYGVNGTAGVKVSLVVTTAQATGGSGSDILINIEGLIGSKYNDTMTGNGNANVLNGGAGADRLTGSDGSDTYVVDNSGDIVTESNETASTGGTDLVQSYITYSLVDTDGAGAYGGNVENLRLLGTTALNGTGNGLNNVLYANAGSNTLNGGNGIDTVSYQYGVSGTTGVKASLAVTTAQATGGSGSDTLIGIERLIGSNYNDTFTGSTGNNILTGGLGKDALKGNGGNDIFDFNALSEMGTTGTTADVISDFNSGDKIDLSTLDANTATTTNDAFTGFIAGSAAFTTAGQLKLSAGVLYGNTDADASAEFAIALTGVTSLGLSSIIL